MVVPKMSIDSISRIVIVSISNGEVPITAIFIVTILVETVLVVMMLGIMVFW